MCCNLIHHIASAMQVDQLSSQSTDHAIVTEESGASLFAPVEVAQLSEHSLQNNCGPTLAVPSGPVSTVCFATDGISSQGLPVSMATKKVGKKGWLGRRLCFFCPATK